jgi:phenylacetate-coenzyme A ligase PaaK-like adenylate-forming protein
VKLRYRIAELARGRKGVLDRLAVLHRNQRLPRPALEAIQLEKLAALLGHAYEQVPYYRRAFDERGLRPADIRSVADLAKLPLLDRTTLLREQASLLAANADPRRLTTNFSSGSTGQRARFVQDEDFKLWMRAFQLRTYGWCQDWEPGERFVLLWGSEIYWNAKTAADKLFNLLTNRREFNTFRLSADLVARFTRAIERLDPVLISSYSNALHLIARQVRDAGIKLPSLRAVQATSEPFPAPIRQRVAEAFGCEVYDKYGSRETNIVSHECPSHSGMLIQVENVVVEILRDDGSTCDVGETGRVVLTTLNNHAMPLIRYETSDLASLSAERSRGPYDFPVMSNVVGRKQDLIVTPDGTYIDSYFFSYLLMRFEAIQWFQVVQSVPDRLLIRVVSRPPLDSTLREEVAALVTKHTGFAFQLEFEMLTEMPESPTGKFRLCVSELPQARSVREAIEA